MCGRINVIDDPAVRGLCEQLGIELWPDNSETLFRRFVRATNKIGIIRENCVTREFTAAIWWLLLEQTGETFKPSKYTSFNTRYDKLNTPRSAGYKAFRESRCIIPVKGFGETQGRGSTAIYTDFSATEDNALALGGLCRDWVHRDTGEHVVSCSVITLPAHPKIAPYHNKAMPLILNQNDDSMKMWLNADCTDTRLFEDLLKPSLPQNLEAMQIDRPSTHRQIGDKKVLTADVV